MMPPRRSNPAPRSSRLACRPYRQLDADSVHDAADRVEAGIGAWRERPVQALAVETGIGGDLGHATRFGDGAETGQQRGGVAAVEKRHQELGDGLVIGQVLGGVERGEGHRSDLQSLDQLGGFADVSVLRRFVAPAQQQVNNLAALRVVDPVSRADIDPHFKHPAAQKLVVAEGACLGHHHPCGDAGLGDLVLQAVKPVVEFRRRQERVHADECSLWATTGQEP